MILLSPRSIAAPSSRWSAWLLLGLASCAGCYDPGALINEVRSAALRSRLVGRLAIDAGERDPEQVRRLMRDLIDAEPLAELDYAEVVDAATLQVVDPLAGELRLLAAARFGKARLIDNMPAQA